MDQPSVRSSTEPVRTADDAAGIAPPSHEEMLRAVFGLDRAGPHRGEHLLHGALLPGRYEALAGNVLSAGAATLAPKAAPFPWRFPDIEPTSNVSALFGPSRFCQRLSGGSAGTADETMRPYPETDGPRRLAVGGWPPPCRIPRGRTGPPVTSFTRFKRELNLNLPRCSDDGQFSFVRRLTVFCVVQFPLPPQA